MNQEIILAAIEVLQLNAGVQRVQQIRKVDSIKNKTDLMRAAQEKNIENLKKLLDLGVDPNFKMSRQGYEFSPLAMACLQKSEEAVGLLLDHGADEAVLLNDLGPNEVYHSNALVMAINSENEDIISSVYERHKEHSQLMSPLKKVHNPRIVMSLLDMGFYEREENKKIIFEVFDKMLSSVNKWRIGSYLKAIEAVYKRFPEIKIKKTSDLWRMGIEHDQWSFCQRLAKEGVALPSWQLKVGKVYVGYSNSTTDIPMECPASLVSEQKSGLGYGNSFIQDPNTENMLIDPIGFALRHKSATCLEAFLKIAPLREMYEKNKLSQDFAVFSGEKCLSVLKEAGVDLTSIKESTWGINPLHVYLKQSYRLSKSGVLTMLQLEPQWALMQDNNGKNAVERIKDASKRAEIQSLIDDKVLRKLSPRKGVKKAKPVSKRL